MLNVFEDTGGSSAFPSYIMNQKSFKENKKEYTIDPFTRSKMQAYIGYTTRALVNEMIESPRYKRLDEEEKLKAKLE